MLITILVVISLFLVSLGIAVTSYEDIVRGKYGKMIDPLILSYLITQLIFIVQILAFGKNIPFSHWLLFNYLWTGLIFLVIKPKNKEETKPTLG